MTQWQSWSETQKRVNEKALVNGTLREYFRSRKPQGLVILKGISLCFLLVLNTRLLLLLDLN